MKTYEKYTNRKKRGEPLLLSHRSSDQSLNLNVHFIFEKEEIPHKPTHTPALTINGNISINNECYESSSIQKHTDVTRHECYVENISIH